MGQTQIKKTVALRLKQARVAAGYDSAEEFCKQYNLDVNRYQLHESGERAIRASIAIEYCRILQVSLNWLLLGEETTMPKVVANKHDLNHAHH